MNTKMMLLLQISLVPNVSKALMEDLDLIAEELKKFNVTEEE